MSKKMVIFFAMIHFATNPIAIAAHDPAAETRRAIVEEARAAFRKKDFRKALSILTRERKGVVWIVDPIYVQRQRLLGQTLLRLQKYEEAENANLESFGLDPSLLDIVYDTACAAALQGHATEALKNLEILWYQVADNPTQKKRYHQLMTKDPDLRVLAKERLFPQLLMAFAGGAVPDFNSFTTVPLLFAATGDDIRTGDASHQIMTTLMCGQPRRPGFRGIQLFAPVSVRLNHKGKTPLQFQLPICMDYMIFSRDVENKSTPKRRADVTWIIQITDSAGRTFKGPYYGIQNSKDHRTGKVTEHPIEPPPVGPGPEGTSQSSADYGTGGRDITNIAWHVNVTPPLDGEYKIKVYNDVYESNEVVVDLKSGR